MKNKYTHYSHERGDVAIYIALVILLIITSSALIFNAIFLRQIRQSRQFVSSTQAFYAANTGLEQALYLLATREELYFEDDGEIVREDETAATFSFKAQAIEREGRRVPCVLSIGRSGSETRKIFTGPAECELE